MGDPRERGPLPRSAGQSGRRHPAPRRAGPPDLRQPGFLSALCPRARHRARPHVQPSRARRRQGDPPGARLRAAPAALCAADRDRARTSLGRVGGARGSGQRRRHSRGAMPGPRHHRAAAHRGRSQRGAQAGGSGQPRQVALPCGHEPRDPHADERHPRHDLPALRHGPLRRAAHLRPRDRALGAHAALADRRDPRFLQDRGRQAAAQFSPAGDRRVRAGCRRAAGAESLREGHRGGLGGRPGAAASAAGR